jgi:hypothetical protein
MTDPLIEGFLRLLTAENRAWLSNQPLNTQTTLATRHLDVMEGDKGSSLQAHDVLNPEASGVALGDLQDPEKVANALVRQAQERQD